MHRKIQEIIGGLHRSLRTTLKRASRSRHVYEPLITIHISKRAIPHNLSQFRKVLSPKKSIVPVLKSNAYGHGLIQIAEILERSEKTEKRKNLPIPFFIVDSYFEAITLRNHSIDTPLLVIGYTPPHTIIENNLKNISFVITSIDALQELFDLQKGSKRNLINIHIKIDTGMHRQGIMPQEIDTAISFFANDRPASIHLDGICSHFASADDNVNTAIEQTESQIKKWNEIVKKVRDKIPNLKWWHTSNTAGHAYEKNIDSNLSRLGIGLYGIDQNAPINKLVHLTPALSMKTIVSDVKKIVRGASVGYSSTFVAPNDMTIATIPAGYFEGIDRRLSNIGSVEMNGQPCPIVGRVSMNITTVDVGDANSVHRGDEVIIISADSSKANSVANIAKLCSTIPYEILVHIPAHLRRVVGE